MALPEHRSSHSLAALAAIVNISADGIIALDDDFKIVRFNRGAEEMFGWEESDLLGQPLDRLLPASARAIHRGHVHTFADGPTESRRMAERREVAGLRRSGEQFPAEASIARVTMDGHTTFMVTLRDVSARRRAEERQRLLSTAGWLLAASLDVDSTMATVTELPLPLLGHWSMLELLTGDGGIQRVAASHHDARKQELTSRLVLTNARALPTTPSRLSGGRIAHESAAQRVLDIAGWAAANAGDERERGLFESLGGSSVLVVPLRASGRAVGALHLVRTTPGGTHSEDEAQVAEQYAGLCVLALENTRLYQEARRALKDRDDMLSVVSHDLRNPVNAIVLLTGAALHRADGDMPLMSRDEVESIRAASRQADGLIQDLQDVSRIAMGRLRVDPVPTSIIDIIEEAAMMFEPAVKDAELTLLRVIDTNAPNLAVDRSRILQVLSNLMGNALRFTPPEGVLTVTLETRAHDLRIAVRDTGPGVNPADVARVFERYWQAPRLLRAGSGLGLYIAKGIVDAHGGDIGLISTPGQGSEFWFTLPLPATIADVG
jgi:PAS domain S-box-containing protein